MAKRFTFGSLDKRDYTNTKTQVIADDYELKEGFVTFTLDGEKILSLPYSKVGLVAALDEDNNLPITKAD